MPYLAIVKVENNKIAKYQEYQSESDADTHVERTGGFVVETPASGHMEYWVIDEEAKTITHDASKQTADEIKESALRNIRELEITVTQRRIREMTTADGAKWVDDVEKLIAVERAKL
tara:strand:+ start:117 stop:467 length:351 start_codon:yes stop_codon:yes gene_type:complete